MNIAISSAAMALYLGAGTILAIRLAKGTQPTSLNRWHAIAPGLIAVTLHAVVLYGNVFTAYGLNLGFFNALSAKTIAAALIFIS